ncbi:MAG: hypothetical protein KDE54_28815, partial [Caldilineaceae bacterium]|nr:hypothetical protein [Caldilineaceae bacterium]
SLRLLAEACSSRLFLECALAYFGCQALAFADIQINTGIEVRLLREVELLGYQDYFVNTQYGVIFHALVYASLTSERPPHYHMSSSTVQRRKMWRSSS